MSTLDRSIASRVLAVFMAEYVLRWVPEGTHDWSKFLKPEELVTLIQRTGLDVTRAAGFELNPITGKWTVKPHLGMNYILFSTKALA